MDRLAHGLEKLRSQVNARWPNRSKDSDGWIGDASHQTRTSDHNPWIKDGNDWVVSAIDLTHDPIHGFDSYLFADHLLAKQDPRLKYVISNRRIGSGPAGPSPGKWRKYTGSNPHDHHCHISIKSDKADYDSTKDWVLEGMATPQEPVTYAPPRPTIRLGDRNEHVKFLQTKLGLRADSIFGEYTRRAVVAIQNKRGLEPDGIVGPQTWKIIEE